MLHILSMKAQLDKKLKAYLSNGKKCDLVNSLAEKSGVNPSTILKYYYDQDRDFTLTIADKIDSALDEINNTSGVAA